MQLMGKVQRTVTTYISTEGTEFVMLERSEWADGVPLYLSGVPVLTDGSKADTGTGARVYCEELRLTYLYD